MTQSSKRITPRIEKLLNDPLVAATGRIRAYLENPELNTNAPSCMLRVWQGNLAEELCAISHYIRKGAGVKIHFTDKAAIAFEPVHQVKWSFFVDPQHNDFRKATETQMLHYRNLEVWVLEETGWDDYHLITVEDNMESIEASWGDFIDAAIAGKYIMLNLNALRPAGLSSKGVISTGVFGIGDTDTGFLDVYRWIAQHLEGGDIGSLLRLLGGLCKVLARGGTRKGGIVTTAMDYRNNLIKEYLNYPLGRVLGGSKKGIRFDKEILTNSSLCHLIVQKVNSESLMLEKIQADDLYLNVCVSGDTKVFTIDGKISVRELVGRPFVAINEGIRHPSTPKGFWSNGVKPVVKVTTASGKSIKCTRDHLLLIWLKEQKGNARFAWVGAGSLHAGDFLRVQDHRVPKNFVEKEFDPERYLDEILAIEPAGEEEVFDCTIPKSHCFDGNDFFVHNCMGILLAHKASCLISHANAGRCKTPADLGKALCKTTEFVCQIHEEWRQHTKANPDLYLPREDDKQIAIGWLGWANFLRQQGVTYEEHVAALKAYRLEKITEYLDAGGSELAMEIACELHDAYEDAATIARSHGLERAFTIEPTQRCYRDYLDNDGFTACRNIDPPFSQIQFRDSGVYGDEMLNHGEVEIIADVGHDLHQEHWEEWQYLMDKTGLPHAMSFDLYKTIDMKWFRDFVVRSPLVSTYYNMAAKVRQDYLNKGQVLPLCDDEEGCVVCA
ncbi:MAG: hypothetical protein PUP93_16745 [Rhizonema sp. NSF051]|nr:hypothetical protein [Rhizonema sp. NSF051]